ncbi:MAG: thermonuclease family protein [Betaproteobacteria bacterium]|nr:thermonuclease family protein [Betaproteobacteria bacterium]
MLRAPVIIFCTFIACPAPLAAEMTARVVNVADGDTITVLTPDKKQLRVRLAGIDAPERKQPFGSRSRQNLSGVIHGKEVQLDCYKADQYRRQVCRVYLNGRDVGLDQVREGFAWWYRRYVNEQESRERKAYESAETEAKTRRAGLWVDKSPVPPWEWRQARRRRR